MDKSITRHCLMTAGQAVRTGDDKQAGAGGPG